MMELSFTSLSLTLNGRKILRGISGIFRPGTVTVILGANGAGKSSMVSCLAGLRKPDSGTVTLGDRALSDWTGIQRARHIGLLPQKADIHWDVSVRNLVALGRLPHQGRWGHSKEDEAAIDTAMAQTDCTHLADRTALRLSGGEQARVLLARVLAGQPDWILADEPLANLDLAHQLDAIDCLRTAAEAGAGVVLVLHDLTLAARIADQLLVMTQGEVIAAGPPAEVLNKEVLAQAYDVDTEISTDSRNGLIVTPLERIT
jgi:iron complex transport system ATP-binding protein